MGTRPNLDFSLQDETINGTGWFVCTLLSARFFNREIMMATLQTIWNFSKFTTLERLNDKVTLIKIGCANDRVKLIEGAPWFFNRGLVCFQEYDGNKRPGDYFFDSADFWVQVMDLPHRLINEQAAKAFGNSIGEYIKYDESLTGKGDSEILRIRIKIDVTKPLTRYLKVKVSETRVIKCHIGYEKLQIFCKTCGKMGHNVSDCNDEQVLDEDGKPYYDECLRISPYRPGGRTLIRQGPFIESLQNLMNEDVELTGKQITKKGDEEIQAKGKEPVQMPMITDPNQSSSQSKDDNMTSKNRDENKEGIGGNSGMNSGVKSKDSEQASYKRKAASQGPTQNQESGGKQFKGQAGKLI